MGYPLNAESFVDAEAAPAEPLTEDLEATGQLDVDEAGVEVAGSFFAGVPELIRQATHEGASISGEGFFLGNLRWAACRSGERPLA